eukprot:Sdes_comp15947_c0_seq1m5094
MSAPQQLWNKEELENVSKREILEFLHAHGSHEFLKKQGLYGKVTSIVKSCKKGTLDSAYFELFETGQFRTSEDEETEEKEKKLKEEENEQKEKKKKEEDELQQIGDQKKLDEKNKTKSYRKVILKKGNHTTFPKRGDTVRIRYRGTFEDGTIFDDITGKKHQPLTFKVGMGKVIQGWDDAILSMSSGEQAQLVIESEFAYGKKGVPDAKVPIPPHTRLCFFIELVGLD